MRLIKRYSNRRYYDATSSKSIHLEDIANYLMDGEDIKIIDKSSGKDITSKVLAQTFIKIVTNNKSDDFKKFLFSSLIREVKTDISKFLLRLIQGGIGTELLSIEKITSIVEDFIGKGELKIQEKDQYLNEIASQLNLQKENFKEILVQKLLKSQTYLEWEEKEWNEIELQFKSRSQLKNHQQEKKI